MRTAIAVVGLVVLGGLTGVEEASAQVETRPIQVSLVTPIQIVDQNLAVKGLRLNLIYGRNAAMTGLDIGVVNHTDGLTKALQWGLVGISEANFVGYQNNWIANITKGDLSGLQIGGYNEAGGGEGVQIGLFSNVPNRMSGLQISLVNYAKDLHGLQIGLLNIISSKESFPILPIVNWKFEN
jgi:hypothetical protein